MSAPATGRRSTETARGESTYDLQRLERAVAALVERKRALEVENAELRTGLEDREQAVRSLELRIAETDQRREGARKRLDVLIERLAALEAQLEPRDC